MDGADGILLDALRRAVSLTGGAWRAALRAAERAISGRLPPGAAEPAVRVLRTLSDVDAATLEGFRYAAQATLEMYRDAWQRRRRGEYRVDDFGMDEEFVDLVRPIFAFLYHTWWRVEMTGVEHIPNGPCLLVANHSGVLPWDGAMIAFGVAEHHPDRRIVRPVVLDWFSSVPFVAPFLARIGCALACPENTTALLERGHAVLVFPEGVKGIGKPFSERYRLARFGRGGFVRVAIRARVPILPVSVVGAEEIHPNLMRLDWLSRPLGLPYLVITPTFAWLGLLGLIPLPTKWRIHISEPVRTDELDPREAGNYLTVARITEQVRGEVQRQIRRLLRRRKSVFLG